MILSFLFLHLPIPLIGTPYRFGLESLWVITKGVCWMRHMKSSVEKKCNTYGKKQHYCMWRVLRLTYERVAAVKKPPTPTCGPFCKNEVVKYSALEGSLDCKNGWRTNVQQQWKNHHQRPAGIFDYLYCTRFRVAGIRKISVKNHYDVISDVNNV